MHTFCGPCAVAQEARIIKVSRCAAYRKENAFFCFTHVLAQPAWPNSKAPRRQSASRLLAVNPADCDAPLEMQSTHCAARLCPALPAAEVWRQARPGGLCDGAHDGAPSAAGHVLRRPARGPVVAPGSWHAGSPWLRQTSSLNLAALMPIRDMMRD